MQIKKLPKEILDEGISLQLVNSIDMKKCFSPVQIQKGDEPVKLISCSTGYWVLYDGKNVLKDAKGAAIVFDEKTCQIARARYLLKHGKKEKNNKIKALIQDWKDKVRTHIDKVKKDVSDLEAWELRNLETASDIVSIIGSQNPERFKAMKKAALTDLKRIKPLYIQIEGMWNDNKIVELMSIFKIKKFEGFGEPMLSAQYDNEHDMKILVNSFGGKALKKWDGDMLNRYATIEIEKEYPI